MELAGLAALGALACGAACLTPLAHGGLLAPRAGRAGPSSASGCSRRRRAARSRGWAAAARGRLLGGALARETRARVPRRGPDAHAYKATIRAAGLGTIMTRSGLELDVGAIRRAGRVAARLTVLPGVSEALAVALFARWVFELPFVLALALGFILAAVSPAVVVVGLFDLHSRATWVAKGIPSIVAAASMDDVVAMLGFSVCIGLAGGAGNIYQKALAGLARRVVAGALHQRQRRALAAWSEHHAATARTLGILRRTRSAPPAHLLRLPRMARRGRRRQRRCGG